MTQAAGVDSQAPLRMLARIYFGIFLLRCTRSIFLVSSARFPRMLLVEANERHWQIGAAYLIKPAGLLLGRGPGLPASVAAWPASEASKG
jgi:hypothetical protein